MFHSVASFCLQVFKSPDGRQRGAVDVDSEWLRLSHLLCPKAVLLPPYCLPAEIWGAASIWGGWAEVELLFTVLQKDQVWVWVRHSGLSSLWVWHHLNMPVTLGKSSHGSFSGGSCWWSHGWFIPAALWLPSLLFPPWLAKVLNFSGDVSCPQDKLDLHSLLRLAVVFHS